MIKPLLLNSTCILLQSVSDQSTQLTNFHSDLSDGIELLKCVSGKFCFECVSKIKSILSIFVQAVYRAVHIQLAHFSHDDCDLITIIKSEV